MSGGANKKKPPRAQGWEEAGGEFYQENYSTADADLEVLQRDPTHLATLLPSKQSRAATTKRVRTTDTKTLRRKTSTTRSRRESSIRRPSTTADVQVAMLPDLSENLPNEQRTWEEIMLIKDMPISMAQKKEMKAKLQNEPNLRLQGYEQFKWRRRKFWQQLEIRFKETYKKLELWRNDLKRIEGNFGTGVVAYFLFLKWLMFLNLSLFCLTFLFIILPTIVIDLPPSAEDTCENPTSADCCAELYMNATTSDNTEIVLDLVQGTGTMERTLLFYGFYPNKIYEFFLNDTKFFYNLPLAYVLTVLVCFLISLLAIVKSAARGFKERLVEGEGQFYLYCNILFAGWDFCIHNEKSAAIKHKALYNEIKGCLEVERLEDERQNRTKEEKTKLFFVRAFVNVVVVSILGGAALGIYFIFDFSRKQLKVRDAATANANLTAAAATTTTVTVAQELQVLFFEFVPFVCIVALNLTVPFVFKYLISFEKYTPNFVIRFTLIRTVLLRLASLIILLMSLHQVVSCDKNDADCFDEKCHQCWETYVGQQFYKLMLTDFATQVLVTFFVNFPRSLIARHVNSRCIKFVGEQEFELPKHVLDVVYTQCLCWLGFFYSPLLPFITTAVCFLIFYIKKFACLVNSKPSTTVYRTSRSNSLFMVVLLVSYVVAVIPIGYSIAELTPSKSCGPFRGLTIVWEDIVLTFSEFPDTLKNAVFFFGTAGFGVPVFIVLILFLYYYSAVNSANRHMVVVLKNQLVLEGHDKQFLLNRLSAFMKQQLEYKKRLRQAEMVREGERIVSSN